MAIEDRNLTVFDRLARTLHERMVSNERESRALAVQRDTLLPGLVSWDVEIEDSKKLKARRSHV